MAEFGSDELQISVRNELEDRDLGVLEIEEETIDTKRMRLKATVDGQDHRVNIDIKDEYISVKHNVVNDESSINLSHDFFDSVKECCDWIVSISKDF